MQHLSVLGALTTGLVEQGVYLGLVSSLSRAHEVVLGLFVIEHTHGSLEVRVLGGEPAEESCVIRLLISVVEIYLVFNRLVVLVLLGHLYVEHLTLLRAISEFTIGPFR